jgi:hypothetical protein
MKMAMKQVSDSCLAVLCEKNRVCDAKPRAEGDVGQQAPLRPRARPNAVERGPRRRNDADREGRVWSVLAAAIRNALDGETEGVGRWPS